MGLLTLAPTTRRFVADDIAAERLIGTAKPTRSGWFTAP
jgi:hypothetical protein